MAATRQRDDMVAREHCGARVEPVERRVDPAWSHDSVAVSGKALTTMASKEARWPLVRIGSTSRAMT